MRRLKVAMADIEVLTRGDIPVAAVDEALTKVRALVRYTRRPVIHARVRLTRSADPAVARPVLAQANLYLDGGLARAEATAATAYEAIDLLQAKLRRRLARLAQHWQARRGRQPREEPHEWRHGRIPARRPSYFPRPAKDRHIVRHETYSRARTTPAEAAVEMDQMGYDFHLFTDERTGQDAVVFRAGPTGYRLAELVPAPPPDPGQAIALTVASRPVPRLHLPQAVAQLDATAVPFLFYAEPTAGRGRVLYRRHDGHYGLVIPARGPR